ncbi:TonB-dependent receptor [Sulfurivermis fontis]|uniref:TonB-dependent receptor n=1 Tax=Sulfurivermis fontis TaxID=1972068 RepID=UPI000FD8B934|nr:TonB-dependent receptor [Sulfurivermis fontis]
MARRSFPPRALSALLTFPLIPCMTAAQADEAPAHLEQVTVTAKGYASDALETPAATVSVEREDIQRRNANNVGEALRGLPGLAVASDGAQGQNPVIRGLKKESVVLLVDGMRLNSAQPAGAIASFMSLGLADRVEVVKGPSSVLYGTGALGGTINVLLPQARFEPGTAFDLAAGYDSASRDSRGTAVMNTSAGDHALMAGASLARIGDYESPDGKVARTGYDSDSYIGQYRYRLDNHQQLRLSLQQHTDEDVWFPGSTKPHPSLAVDSTTVHSPKTQRRLTEVGYSRQGSGDAPLNMDVRIYRQEMQRQIFSWAEPLNRNIAGTRVSFDTDGLDAKADWLVHPQHLLSFGVNSWQMQASPERYLASPTPLSPLVRNDPFQDARIEALGFYVQDDMQFGALNVLAGLRHDTVKGSAAAMANPTGPGTLTSGLDRSDSAVSGSLGAIYQITPLLRPYANVARGFRAGEMRERYESSPRGDGYYYVGNPQIKPEMADQLELGLKGANEHLSYTVAAYRTRISDYITGRVTGAVHSSGAPIKATENIGSVTLTGLEAEARWQAAPGQWLSVAYSLVRGDNDDLDEPLFQMPADELSLGWEGRIAAGWTADTTVRFVQKQDRVATVFSNGSENVTPGFTTADIGATWRYAKDQSLRMAVKNLADKAYHEHLTEGVSGQEIKAPGRSVALTWQGSF